MYLWDNSLLMLALLILILKLAVQMMCNHVLYRNDIADFAFSKWGLHCRKKFCFTSVAFELLQRILHFHKQNLHYYSSSLLYCSGFSSAAAGDPSRPPYIYTSA